MRRAAIIAALGYLALSSLCGGGAAEDDGVRLGSFNIRFFPEESTAPDRVADRIAEADADLLAVQEIVDPAALEQALARASARTGRDYRFSRSRYCTRRVWYLGVIYDRNRVQLRAEHRITSERHCRADHPSMHGVEVEVAGQGLVYVSAHLKALGNLDGWTRRRAQWRHLIATQRQLERKTSLPVVIAGDFNSTGIRDDSGGEKSYIERMLAASGLELVTRDIDCTAYWRGGRNRGLAPSTLDQMIARGGQFSRPRPLGMCRVHRCQAVDEVPEDYLTVSDHCPVVTERR